MEIAALVLFATALFVAAASPGPAVAAILARVLGRGVRGTVPFAVGIAIGDVLWLAAAIGGLAVLAQNFHLVFLAVKWIGVAYLAYLAFRMWRAPADPVAMDAPVAQGERPAALFLAGFAVTLGNPKTMIFYLALLPNLIVLETVTLVGFGELALVTLGVLGIVFGFYVLLAARARRYLMTPRSVRFVNRISAGAMAGAASWVATR